MKKFVNEFRDFALRGNVMDLAVGVIIGAAFQSVVTSLTDNIISPPLNMSSAVICAAFFWPINSPNARNPLVSAARSPASCVPPAGVGMVLQYQL